MECADANGTLQTVITQSIRPARLTNGFAPVAPHVREVKLTIVLLTKVSVGGDVKTTSLMPSGTNVRMITACVARNAVHQTPVSLAEANACKKAKTVRKVTLSAIWTYARATIANVAMKIIAKANPVHRVKVCA